MEITFCKECGQRIPEEEIAAGRVTRVGEDCFCERCSAKKTGRRLKAETAAQAESADSGRAQAASGLAGLFADPRRRKIILAVGAVLLVALVVVLVVALASGGETAAEPAPAARIAPAPFSAIHLNATGYGGSETYVFAPGAWLFAALGAVLFYLQLHPERSLRPRARSAAFVFYTAAVFTVPLFAFVRLYAVGFPDPVMLLADAWAGGAFWTLSALALFCLFRSFLPAPERAETGPDPGAERRAPRERKERKERGARRRMERRPGARRRMRNSGDAPAAEAAGEGESAPEERAEESEAAD